MPHPLCVSGGMEREMRRCARINEISLVYSLDPRSKVNLRIVEDCTLHKLQINVVSIFFFSSIFFTLVWLFLCRSIHLQSFSSLFRASEWLGSPHVPRAILPRPGKWCWSQMFSLHIYTCPCESIPFTQSCLSLQCVMMSGNISTLQRTHPHFVRPLSHWL